MEDNYQTFQSFDENQQINNTLDGSKMTELSNLTKNIDSFNKQNNCIFQNQK